MNGRRTVKDQLIEQCIMIAGGIVMLYVTRKMMQPDFLPNLKMRAALGVKRFADMQVKEWERVASHAATVYQKAQF